MNTLIGRMKDYAEFTFFDTPPALKAELIALGFDPVPSKTIPLPQNKALDLTRLAVPVDDERLPPLITLAENFGGRVIYFTKFNKRDIETAHWFQLEATSWLGYPKPESTWKESVYDLTTPDYCPTCGIGRRQQEPFHVASSHRAGKTASLMHLGWVYDEFFVTRQVRDVVCQEKLTGIDFLPALKAGSKEPFDNLFQVLVEKILPECTISTAGFDQVMCSRCQRVKFNYSMLALSAASQSFANAPDIIKSAEWFGSGASANRLVIVSRRFQRLVAANHWRQVRFRPLCLVD